MADAAVVYRAEVLDVFGEDGSGSVPDFSLFRVRIEPPLSADAISPDFTQPLESGDMTFAHLATTASASLWELELTATPEDDPHAVTDEEYVRTEPIRAEGRAKRLYQAARFVADLMEALNRVEDSGSVQTWGNPVDIATILNRNEG